jgi:FKBP-type peptidyl-prolyl cis-trans isomerase
MIPAPSNVSAAPEEATSTESGLKYVVIQKGTGQENPNANSKVNVHYTGWTTDGEMFDSSVERGEPISFGLNQVIKGWTEGVQKMVVGEKTRFWIPQELAYQGRSGAPAGMLVFDVELLSFTSPPAPPPPPEVPENVDAAPADALSTPSGLKYKVLQEGTGQENPKATSTVNVHYSGWMTNGEMFDSSVVRGEPISFGLNQVIPGWTEGVQKMVVGEKTRFWIPGKLAYGETPSQPGYPYGTLVFDVELLSIS